MPNRHLEFFVVHHVAAKLAVIHDDWKLWTRALKAHDRFGADVAVRVAKLHSKNYATERKAVPQHDSLSSGSFCDDDMNEDPDTFEGSSSA